MDKEFKAKDESFEEKVLELIFSEDEFIDRILVASVNYLRGNITKDRLAETLDNVHDSAHVSLEQRWSGPDARAGFEGELFQELDEFEEHA